MVMRILDQRVPMEWVFNEVRVKSKLDYNPEMFSIAEDHLILRLLLEKECSSVKNGEPWFVTGQLLTMEAWELDFIPGRRVIQKAVVWMRLPRLPLEYWLSMAIFAIVAEVGRRLSIDDFTDMLRKMGYAHMRVEIDTGKSLKPSILIREKKGAFWQQFVYENLPPAFYQCGRLGHADECC